MKKLLFTLTLIFTLLVSCEKLEFKVGKLEGTYSSETFKLADLDLVKMNLVITEGLIEDLFLNSLYLNLNYGYLFEVDSISDNTIVYFHFQNVNLDKYNGILEINKSNSELIGYLNVKRAYSSYYWEYVLYFN